MITCKSINQNLPVSLVIYRIFKLRWVKEYSIKEEHKQVRSQGNRWSYWEVIIDIGKLISMFQGFSQKLE